MPKFAWIEQNVVRDVSFHPDPTIAYTPEIAALYNTIVPDEVGICWTRKKDGSFAPPVETPPVVSNGTN
jgi:predicted Rdx family selenoprotein